MSEVPDTCANYAPPALPTYPALPTNPSNSLSHPTSRNAPAGERHGGVGESPQPDDLDLEEWVAFGDWVAEVCPEQLDEPQPLFSCDNAANARQVVSIHNELVAKVRALTDENERCRIHDCAEYDAMAQRAITAEAALAAERENLDACRRDRDAWQESMEAELEAKIELLAAEREKIARVVAAAEAQYHEKWEAFAAASNDEKDAVRRTPSRLAFASMDASLDALEAIRAALSGVTADTTEERQ